MDPRAHHPIARRDALIAVLIALLLSVAWALRDWPNLAALRLPDTDDAMRLQQIRDWIGGQPFADLAQHRLGGPPGLEMHWSRLPDLIPATTIVLLTPFVGAPGAELAAVLAWPALLFAAALATIASIARTLGVSGPVAAVVAALAYPATTVFMPGRIDHHGLQLVLILVLVRGLLGRGSLRAGAAAGLATAASLAIGLETAPLLAVGGIALVVSWVLDRQGAQARLLGYATVLVLALAGASAALRTSGWSYPACDGFTAELWRAAQLVALAALLLAAVGFALDSVRARTIAAAGIGFAAVAGAAALSPGCLHPYGGVDPLLARLWLAHVGEAQPLLAAPLVQAIGYAGLALAGLLACGWQAWRTRDSGWIALFAFQATAVALTFVQLRGAYACAVLAAPALAAMIAAARTRGALPLAAAWIVSAGLLYPIAGGFARQPVARAHVEDCTARAALARIAALPPGRLIAPVDLGAFALADAPHSTVAAPYHRNSQGNLAMYQFFLGPAAGSEALARQWGVDYVALCPDSFEELGAAADDPRSLSGQLRAGRIPAWLRPISRPGEAPTLYALTPRN